VPFDLWRGKALVHCGELPSSARQLFDLDNRTSSPLEPGAYGRGVRHGIGDFWLSEGDRIPPEPAAS
jgi:hypothetical protein